MRQHLDINLYGEGFEGTLLNCVDMPIAICSGYYDYYNYFYYCFYYCLYNNWKKDNEQWFDRRGNILSKLGLEMKPIPVEDASSFMESIRYHIDLQHPLLFLASYSTLFYHEGYLNDAFRDTFHGIIINGYDTEKSLVSIKENSHIANDLGFLSQSYLMCNLMLPEDVLLRIWEKSYEIYKNNKYDFNMLSSIEKTGDTKIPDYDSLFGTAFENINAESDTLVEFIRKFNSEYNHIESTDHANYLRRCFVNSLSVIFDIFERAYGFLKYNTEMYSKYEDIKGRFIKRRMKIVNNLITEAYAGNTISHAAENEIVENIITSDNMLFNFFREFIKNKDEICSNSSLFSFYLADQASVKGGKFADTVMGNLNLFIIENYPEPNRNWESYMKFDLHNFKAEKCSQASLKLYCNYLQSAVPVELYALEDNSWRGSVMTWNSRPAAGELAAAKELHKQKEWYTFDVTDTVNRAFAAGRMVSLALKAEKGYNVGANFCNKNIDLYQPVLEIML